MDCDGSAKARGAQPRARWALERPPRGDRCGASSSTARGANAAGARDSVPAGFQLQACLGTIHDRRDNAA